MLVVAAFTELADLLGSFHASASIVWYNGFVERYGSIIAHCVVMEPFSLSECLLGFRVIGCGRDVAHSNQGTH